MLRWCLHGSLVGALLLSAKASMGAGPPVLVVSDPPVSPSVAKRVRTIVAQRRAVREELALPPAESQSPEQATLAERTSAIRLSLDRAVVAESEAAWDTCVREGAGAMSDAIQVLARTNDLALLRDLHIQIGACLTLAGNLANAHPHFVSAALLDESPPKTGRHREEAERAQAEARAQVCARSRGRTRIETVPPGADLWIDGHGVHGKTPIEVDVRLGEHFVTLRRFRYEPHTELALLQPSGVVRIVMDPAQRGTLREQLSALEGGTTKDGGERERPSDDELRLARTVWSRAEQSIVVRLVSGQSHEVALVDGVTGEVLRSARVQEGESDRVFQEHVCSALGETCAPAGRSGVPWYVWPVSGIAVAGAVVSATFIVESSRSYRYCFGGCRN